MRLHLGQRQVIFEDLWVNVSVERMHEGLLDKMNLQWWWCVCVCVEGVFLLTGVWEAKGRYSFEKASEEDNGPWSGPWGDVWLDRDLLRGPTVPESNDLGANFERKKYFNPSRNKARQATLLQQGATTNCTWLRLQIPWTGTKGHKQNRWPIALLIYFYVSVVFQRVENPVLPFPFSCQRQSSTGPYSQARCAFYHSLFPSLLRTNILWPVQPPHPNVISTCSVLITLSYIVSVVLFLSLTLHPSSKLLVLSLFVCLVTGKTSDLSQFLSLPWSYSHLGNVSCSALCLLALNQVSSQH